MFLLRGDFKENVNVISDPATESGRQGFSP